MADPGDEPRTPPPPGRPGQPLPRLRYTPPAAESEPPPPAAKPSRSAKPSRDDRNSADPRPTKKKARKPVDDDEPKGTLVEATPAFDTVEARQRTRIIVGAALVGIVSLSGFLLFRALQPDREDEYGDIVYGDLSEPRAPGVDPVALNREADVVLADARSFATQDNSERTLELLRRLGSAYEGTNAATQAQEALDRGRRGLPVFADIPLVIAELAEPEPVAPPVVVEAPRPAPPPVASAPELPPPPVPPEPRRWTGVTTATSEVTPKSLPDGFRPREGIGTHPSGWPLEITCDKDGGAMVLVPPGTFRMGRDDGPAEERPAHDVALSAFYIDQHEITNRQFGHFRQAQGARADEAPATDDPLRPDKPVTEVTAREAYDYARWAGKSVPTEAQWEFAARSVDGRIHPWGATAPIWDRPREPGQIDPVMSFNLDMSPHGVFDLAGNAREWTADWFDPAYYQQFADSVAVNPSNTSRGNSRIPLLTIKGGSPEWFASRRDGMRPEARLPDLGFRCVLNLDGPPPAAPAQPTLSTVAPKADRRLEAPGRAGFVQFPPGSHSF